MTKTEIYQLPQWEATDRVLREDFNDAMSKIEGALDKKIHIVTGTYTGNGTASQFIPLAATPQALIVTFTGRLGSGNITYGGIVTPETPNSAVAIGEGGFTAYGNGNTSGNRPMANAANHQYAYFALYWSE